MGLRFIRQPSDTPNVSNTDDARMIRYAYGDQNGYIQNAGNELSYTIIGKTFRINSGVIVLQGWESEIDSNGWSMSIDDVTTKRYYSVYYEVNLSTQTTAIKSEYAINEYPEIEKGDDLTAMQTGIARLLLYQFSSQNGTISEVAKKVNMVLYGTIISSRPPITGIQFLDGDYDLKGTGLISKGDNLRYINILQNDDSIYSNKRITYLPKDSTNSIAQAEFSYSSNNTVIEYLMKENGDIMCYAKKSFRAHLSPGTDIGFTYIKTTIDVQAKLTDLYGNEYVLKWSVTANIEQGALIQ